LFTVKKSCEKGFTTRKEVRTLILFFFYLICLFVVDSTISIEVNRTETFEKYSPMEAKKKPQGNESAYLNDPIALPEIKTVTAHNSAENGSGDDNATADDSRRGSKTDSIANNQGVEFSQLPTGRKTKASKGDESKKGRKKSKGNEGHSATSKPPSASNSVTENSIAEGSERIRENSGRHLNSDGKSSNESRKGSSHPTTAADKGRSIAMLGNNRKSNSSQVMDDDASLNSFSSYENNSVISDHYPRARNDLIHLLQEKEQLLAKQERELETELKKRVKEYIRTHGIGFGNSSTIPTVSSSGVDNNEYDMNDSLITGESNKTSGNRSEEHHHHQAASIHFPHVDLVNSLDGGLAGEVVDVNSSAENNDNRHPYHTGANSQSINLSSFVDFPDSESNLQRMKTDDGKSYDIDQDMNNLDSFLLENGLNDAAVRNELEVIALTSGGKPSQLASRLNSSNKQLRIPSREGGTRLRDLRQYPADVNTALKETLRDSARAATFRQELLEVKARLRATDPNNKLYSTEGIPEIDQMIETIYNNVALSGSKAIPEDWKLIQIATTDQLRKPVTQATSTSTDDLEDFVTNKQHQLPVYDNQANILITRTYKPSIEPISFEEKLRQSSNPLHFLYQHYSDYLSQLQKDRLFFAAVSNTVTSSSSIVAMNEKIQEISNTLPQRNRNHIVTAAHHILTISKKLLDECTTLLPLINAIETLVNDSVQIVKTIQRSGNNPSQLNDLPPQNYLVNSLSDLFR
jgi:hypothetical protein